MKKVYFFSAIAFMLVTLSACKLGSKEESKDTTATPVTSNADSMLDDQIFQSSTTAGNLEGCNKILDDAKKQECTDIIESNLKTSEAINKGDKELCEDIKLDRYKENCFSSIDDKVESENQDSERLSVQQEAYDKKDYSICDEISDTNQKASCKFDVISQLPKKAPSLCEQIDEEMLVNKCKAGLQK